MMPISERATLGIAIAKLACAVADFQGITGNLFKQQEARIDALTARIKVLESGRGK